MELRLLREWVGGQSHEGYGLMVSKLRIALDGSHALGILVCTCMAIELPWMDRRAGGFRRLACCRKFGHEGNRVMLWTIFVILLILWLLGVVSSYTLGGFIHLLLVLALVVLVIQLIEGRRPVV